MHVAVVECKIIFVLALLELGVKKNVTSLSGLFVYTCDFLLHLNHSGDWLGLTVFID